MEFNDEKCCQCEVAPVSALFEVAQSRKQNKTCPAADIVDAHLLQSRKDEVADRLGVLPGEDIGSETIVCEAFSWIDKGIAGEFEADVDLFEGRFVCLRGFVGVILDCESSKSGLDAAFLDIVRYTEQSVEVAFLEELVVCFIDRVKEVKHYDGDLDVATMLDEERSSRRWFRVACTDEDCVEGGLDIAGHELRNGQLMDRIVEDDDLRLGESTSLPVIAGRLSTYWCMF